MNNEAKHLRGLLLVAALMLCVAVIPTLPYGFYTLLRLIVCGAAAYAAFKLKDNPLLSGNFIPLSIMAVLFNPFIPVHLTRLIWLVIDLTSAIYLLTLSKKI